VEAGHLINLAGPRPPEGFNANLLQQMRTRIRDLLPRARVDAFDEDGFQAKNRVRWLPTANLDRINDPSILRRIQDIEDELFTSQVPQRLWPQRVLPLLHGDFQTGKAYLEANPATTWLETLVVLCQTLHQGHAIRTPWYNWVHLHLIENELQSGFARRIRDAYYLLGITDRAKPETRDHLIYLIRDAFPTIWSHIQYHHRAIGTEALLNDLTLRSENEERRGVEAAYKTPTVEIVTSGGNQPFHTLQITAGANASHDSATIRRLPAPTAAETPSSYAPKQQRNIITDPRTDDTTVNAATDEALAVSGNCYNCGKPGHWAGECRQKTGFRANTTPPSRGNMANTISGASGGAGAATRGGQPVTITGTLHRGNLLRNVTSAAKNIFSRGSQRGGSNTRGRGRPPAARGGRRQYAVTDGHVEEAFDNYTDDEDVFQQLVSSQIAATFEGEDDEEEEEEESAD
jgi:hypothetical protein